MANELETAAQAAIEEVEQQRSAPARQEAVEGSDLDKQIQQIQRLAKVDRNYAESNEYKELMESLQGQKENPSAQSEEKEEQDEDEEGDETDDSSTDDVFGFGKKEKTEKVIKAEFKVPDEFTSLIEKEFGVKDANTFLNSAAKWRDQAQEATEIKKNNEAILSDLSAMPVELKTAINAWIADPISGEWINSITQQRLDWSTSFENQDVEGLVQHFLPDDYDELVAEFNADNINESEFEKQLMLLAKSTRRSFNESKQALEREAANYMEHIKQSRKVFKDSAITSVNNLGKVYPHFTKSEMNKVRTALVEGRLDDLFINPDGSYKEDAAELVAYAMYGKKMAEQLKKQGERKGRSEANMETVDKSPKTLRKTQSKDAGGPNKDLLNAVEHLKGGFKPRTIFD